MKGSKLLNRPNCAKGVGRVLHKKERKMAQSPDNILSAAILYEKYVYKRILSQGGREYKKRLRSNFPVLFAGGRYTDRSSALREFFKVFSPKRP